MITKYEFGRMTIGGKEYRSDLIIYPDGRVHDSWWRKNGHGLEPDDMTELIASLPELIVTGTGAYGVMKPGRDIRQLLEEKGIAFIAKPTAEAVEVFNNLSTSQRVGGCFHLTC